MHPALLEAYMEALPALEAQEDLRAVTAVALGSGRLEPRTADAALADLRRTAGIRRPRAKRARPEDLRAMGVGVRVQERAQEPQQEAGDSPGPPGARKSLLGAPGEAEEV